MADDADRAAEAFLSLDGDSWLAFLDLNRRIQGHTGWWSVEGYGVGEPLIGGFFLAVVGDLHLFVAFDWPHSQEGRDFFRSTDPGKCAALDVQATLPVR